MEYGEYCLYYFVKYVESHVIQPPIKVSYLLCGILSVQKKDISTCVSEIDDTPSVFSMSYTLIFGKHVVDIVIPIDEIILAVM